MCLNSVLLSLTNQIYNKSWCKRKKMQFIRLTLIKAKFVSGCCVAVSIINLGVISFNYTSLSVLFVSPIIFSLSVSARVCVSANSFLSLKILSKKTTRFPLYD